MLGWPDIVPQGLHIIAFPLGLEAGDSTLFNVGSLKEQVLDT